MQLVEIRDKRSVVVVAMACELRSLIQNHSSVTSEWALIKEKTKDGGGFESINQEHDNHHENLRTFTPVKGHKAKEPWKLKSTNGIQSAALRQTSNEIICFPKLKASSLQRVIKQVFRSCVFSCDSIG